MGIILYSHLICTTIMKTRVFLILALATLSQAATLYSGYEQPDYTVVESNSDYELRRYPASTWVATDTNGANYDDTGSEAFWKLFGYISGANAANKKIDMTVPVITSMGTRSCSFCDMVFTMNFYVPKSVVDSTVPAPTDGRVQIVNMPETEVYVRRFGGFAKGNDFINHASKLHNSLKSNGVSDSDIVMTSFYAVGYDSPWKFMFRRNEVWIVKS